MSKDGTQVLSVLAPSPTVFGITKQALQHLILGKPSRAPGTAPVRVLGLGPPRWSGTVGRSASDPVKGALVMLGPRQGLGPKVKKEGGVIETWEGVPPTPGTLAKTLLHSLFSLH